MGCFLGCFGGEAKEGGNGQRRRRRRSPQRPRLHRPNQINGVFQSVAIELGQSSRRQITPRLSPSPSLEPQFDSIASQNPSLQTPFESIASQNPPSLEAKFPSLESPVGSLTLGRNPSLEPPVQSVTLERKISLESPVNSVPSERRNPSMEPPVELVTLERNISPEPPVEETREVKEKRSTSLPKKKVTFDLNVKTYECPKYPSDDETQEEESVGEKLKLSPSRTTFPSNHRYQNWYVEAETDEIEEEGDQEGEDDDYYYYSDEEYEGLDEIDEEMIGIDGNEEESYESLFSLSIDKKTEMNGANNENKVEEVNSGIYENTPEKKAGPRDRSQFVHQVLNPVENLSQWKEVKFNNNSEKSDKVTTIGTNNSNLEKENKNLDLNNNNNNNNNEVIKREISVDASLSTWLVSSEISTLDQGQNGNFTERPILGALTVDDMKQFSVNSSQKRSPSCEDEPIIGTVGTYWNCTSTGSSRFKEDKIAKCR